MCVRVQVLTQSQSIAPGESALLVNGLETPDLAYYDTFSLLDSLHAETHTLDALHALGFRVRAPCSPARSLASRTSPPPLRSDSRRRASRWSIRCASTSRRTGTSSTRSTSATSPFWYLPAFAPCVLLPTDSCFFVLASIIRVYEFTV